MFGIENKEKDQSDSLFGENPLVLISSSAVYCEVRRLLNEKNCLDKAVWNILNQ